jgi:hypothetical protein
LRLVACEDEGLTVSTHTIRLKSLLQQRHWQVYRTFCNEYDKAAKRVDPKLVGSAPSRAQLHRWLAGDLKGLPYPDHCRVLEVMFPEFSATELFEISPGPSNGLPSNNATNELTDVFETVANNLDAPDVAGNEWEAAAVARSIVPQEGTLPPKASERNVEGVDDVATELGQKLVALKKVLRLSPQEMRLLADAAGHVIELELRLHIDIAVDGTAELSYYYELLNMSSKPITRVVRESWFEYTNGRIEVIPVGDGDRRIAIQRMHDTPTMVKFGCQISPAIQPGDRGVIRYTVKGGEFRDALYWRQTIRRFTRHLTITLRHRGAGALKSCVAVEEHPDGSENSAFEDLLWDNEGEDLVITLTRDYLRPNQSVTLRWDVDREPARRD